jgi:hypothetical protein
MTTKKKNNTEKVDIIEGTAEEIERFLAMSLMTEILRFLNNQNERVD